MSLRVINRDDFDQTESRSLPGDAFSSAQRLKYLPLISGGLGFTAISGIPG
ncbi:hypothetical protein [Endozoicomonas sp. 4G]|uniref:hypothetical protein n=1 Tax=Endozoicomonas sp. 4G TaxID=2872754 RepID=UPI00207883DE|nr:hypothetical protein [Endozoicomonas sp. 4G]